VAFSEAAAVGVHVVEGIRAVRMTADAAALAARAADPPGLVPVVVDDDGSAIGSIGAVVLVDARMLKGGHDTSLDQAPLVIGLGPGFRVGRDCHAVVETMRGPNLGRVLTEGEAEPNTGVPGPVLGVAEERVLRAPAAGRITGRRSIGDSVREGETVAVVGAGDAPVVARVTGILRGMVRDGATVAPNEKVGDVDPRGSVVKVDRISEKALAIAGGVLEAILVWEGAA
jgi:xanthine dehydrogenase accessory factor